MILIKLPDLDASRQPHTFTSNLMYDYRIWLNKNAGMNGPELEDPEVLKDWDWLRGDRYARGVYIRDPEVAVMFRLTFDL